MSSKPTTLNGRHVRLGPLRALSNRSFALLWAGQTISRLGDSLYRIALSWWVLERTGSAAAMGTVLIFSTVPMLIFLLIGGVAVDRFPRLRLMLGSDISRAALVGMISILAYTNALETWHIYLASVVFGFLDAFFQPAYQAIIPDLTPPELLPSANALTNLSNQFIGIIGPGIGALLVKLGGTPTAFTLDASSFLLSAACLIPLTRLATQAYHPSTESTSVLADIQQGISLVRSIPWIWVTIVIFALVNVTASGPFSVTLPFLIEQQFHGDVSTLGWVLSAASAGAVLASLWLGRATKLRHRGPLAYGATIVSGIALLSIGLPFGLVGLLAAGFMYGASLSAFGLVWVNTLQEMVPREQLGRVFSIDMLGSYVFLPIGFGVAGWATDALGATPVFLLGGALTVAIIALGLLHPAVRKLD